jgi:uncharacterized membrane protein
MLALNWLKTNWKIATIITVAGVIFGLITFVNHVHFRTYALDLGAYTNAAYKYAHFVLADNDVFMAEHSPMLSGHFDLYLVLFSPLTYLFGSYTLLIVQWAALLIGGIGVYRLFQFWYPNAKISHTAQIYFYSFYGVFSALSFDYHSVVVASSLVPWFFLFLAKDKFRLTILVFVLCLFAQENAALWMIFIASGLAFVHRKDRIKARILLLLTLVAVAYFLLVMKVIIPFFNPTGAYTGFHFSVLGDSISSFIVHFVEHPLRSIKLLFINHTLDPGNDGLKRETWMLLLISGGWLLLRKPIYLWMLIPIFFQKLYHDSAIMWSVNYQYSIEFAPILAIGIFDVLATIKHDNWRKTASILAVLFALTGAIRLMDRTIIMYDKTQLRIYKEAHYNREFPVDEAQRIVNSLPNDAAISAQSAFVPHFSCRNKIYQFPIIKDADYIVLAPRDSYYPIDSASYFTLTDSLQRSPIWKTIKKNEHFILFKRK